MFNLTAFASGLAYDDPMMFVILFVIMPLGSIAVFVCIVSWFEERRKDVKTRAEYQSRSERQLDE